MKASPTCQLGMESYYELVLTMLTLNYLLYRSVDYDDCLAQFSSKEKEEELQAVLGLLEQKDVETVLPTGFAKSLI